MTSLAALCYALSLLATVLAWARARRHPEHRPVAWLLTGGLALDVARRVLREGVLRPGYAALHGAPAEGALRLAAHLEAALFVAWPFAFAAAAIVVFFRRRPWPLALAWAVLGVAMALGYPSLRDGRLQKVYLAAQLTGVLVGIGATLTWALPLKEKLGIHHLCVALIVVLELGSVLAGPWRQSVFADWHLDQAMLVVLYGALVVLQGGSLWMGSSVSQ